MDKDTPALVGLLIFAMNDDLHSVKPGILVTLSNVFSLIEKLIVSRQVQEEFDEQFLPYGFVKSFFEIFGILCHLTLHQESSPNRYE